MVVTYRIVDAYAYLVAPDAVPNHLQEACFAVDKLITLGVDDLETLFAVVIKDLGVLLRGAVAKVCREEFLLMRLHIQDRRKARV